MAKYKSQSFIDETEITDVEFAILFNDKIPRTGALIGWVSEQINNQNFHFVSAGTISKIQLNENRHPLLSDTRLDFLLIKREGIHLLSLTNKEFTPPFP